MTWSKIDDQFYDHPKVVAAGPLGTALFVCGLSYCSRHLTDGFISTAQACRLIDIDNPGDIAEKLVTVGLWERRDGGYQVHDFLDYNPSAAKVKTERKRNARRQAEWRQKQEQLTAEETQSNIPTNGVTNSVTNNGPVPVPVPVPVPSPDSPFPKQTPSAATAPPSTPKSKRGPSPKQQEAREMFSALAEVCQIDLITITGTQRKQLNQSEKILRKDDAKPADMEPFATWWYANDWRGKQGDAPRPAQVRETWGKFKTWREGGQRSTGKRSGPDEWLARRQEAGMGGAS